jgi:uncharacterized protein (DUF427 family)
MPGPLPPGESSDMAGTPDHPIAITPAALRVRVRFAGHTVAETASALSLREASYPRVLYIPREDVDMTVLVRSDLKTRCPYKGEASYFSIRVDGRTAQNAIWTYEEPLADVAEIAGHMAFYSNRVDSIEELPA